MNNRNELKMKIKNEVEMNTRNEPEMNEAMEMNNGNELEMNNIVEMNDRTEVINQLDVIKRNCYKQTFNSMAAIKLVTDEPVDLLMNSVKRDLKNLNNVYDFIFVPLKKTVEIRLESNAIPIIYYFSCMNNYQPFAKELIEFAEEQNIFIKVIP